jgi:serine/threonine protein kinase
MPPTAGRVIAERYFLEEAIGHGGMGIVWRAHDRLLDRKVAVKEFMPPAAIDSRALAELYQRTKREARTAARLNHRGIVTVYDVAEDDGRLWIVMELVKSRSLDKILASRGPLTALRAARIGQQLLAALSAAHAEGVLHRDVKPSNVLIATERVGGEQDWRAVLTDFGIAQSAGDPRLTMAGTVMGSPGFTAPERLRGAAATPASDLWSLGATLYAAVEGHGPYERDSMADVLAANAHEAPPTARSAGPLAPLIAALLRPEPSARPSASAADRLFTEILAPMGAEYSPTSAVPLRTPTQTFSQLPPRAPGQPGAPPDQPQAASDLFEQFDRGPAGDSRRSGRPHRARRTARQRHTLTVLARTVVVVAALVVGGYLLWQGEVSKHLLGSTAVKEPISPVASTAPLPPVATAPGIVQAIDNPNTTPPADFISESFSAGQLGTIAGFTIGRPPGWKSVVSGHVVKLEGPDGGYVEIDLTKHVKSDMVAEAEYRKVRQSSDFPGYQRIYSPPNQPQKKFIQPETIHQTLGALWEFDWVTGGNVQMRADVLLFNLDNQSYTIYTGGQAGKNDNDWNKTTLGTVSTVLRTFKPVPA